MTNTKNTTEKKTKKTEKFFWFELTHDMKFTKTNVKIVNLLDPIIKRFRSNLGNDIFSPNRPKIKTRKEYEKILYKIGDLYLFMADGGRTLLENLTRSDLDYYANTCLYRDKKTYLNLLGDASYLFIGIYESIKELLVEYSKEASLFRKKELIYTKTIGTLRNLIVLINELLFERLILSKAGCKDEELVNNLTPEYQTICDFLESDDCNLSEGLKIALRFVLFDFPSLDFGNSIVGLDEYSRLMYGFDEVDEEISTFRIYVLFYLLINLINDTSVKLLEENNLYK